MHFPLVVANGAEPTFFRISDCGRNALAAAPPDAAGAAAAQPTEGEGRMRSLCARSRRLLKIAVPASLAVLTLVLAPSSFGVVNLGGQQAVRDFDARGKVAPTASQLAAARAIHGKVSWSRMGTPAQIFHRGGYLATGLKARGAAAAARSYLAAQRQAFGLSSVWNLRLMNAEPMRDAPWFHVVSFRQAFGNVLSADGVVSVSVVKAKNTWKVVYVSSSLTPD